MNRRSVSRSIVLCLSMIIAGALAGSTQQVQPLEPEWLQKMYAEGWQKVQEGVLQRDTGGKQYETFGYGAEGLRWILQGYELQLSRLEEKNSQSPNVQLAMVIVQLEGEIAQLNETLLEFSGVNTRYLRVVNPNGLVGMPEIVVYGTPVTTP